jgi:hypothetical protein
MPKDGYVVGGFRIINTGQSPCGQYPLQLGMNVSQ